MTLVGISFQLISESIWNQYLVRFRANFTKFYFFRFSACDGVVDLNKQNSFDFFSYSLSIVMVSFRSTECKGYAESNRSLSNRKNFIMTSLDFENLFSECMNLIECSSQHYRIFSVVPRDWYQGSGIRVATNCQEALYVLVFVQ